MKVRFFAVPLFLLTSACSSSTTTATAPFQSGSPWPKFRGNLTQDGLSTIQPKTSTAQLHSYHTGKGVFSSPVVGADGTIYIGSADRTFYAFTPDLTVRWSLITGEIIDSAGLLDNSGRVYFGSGDGVLRALDAQTGAVAWMTPADPPHGKENPRSLINWFEGNVALSASGQLYVPNDNFIVYQIDRKSGAVSGRIDVPDQTWSLPAFDPRNGHLYIGNNNVVSFFGSNLFSFAPERLQSSLWENYSPGSVAASPLVTPDGTVVVGGFDGYVRAYDPATGSERWNFGARDHIYASPARQPDGTIVQAATDGAVYGLDEQTGALRWEFDSRDPIRSSPAVDAAGNVYFGSGDGRLYVLNHDGTLRWSVQLISEDRNDVNASPALGKEAVYIAGESGDVFSVPYDYCLRADGKADPRCAPPAPPLPNDGALLQYTTNFGAQLPAPPASLDANEPVILSLVVRQGGRDQLALLDSSQVQVTLDPANSVTTTIAGDGKFMTIIPTQPLVPASDGTVSFTVTAPYLIHPTRDGLKLSGGTPGGQATFHFRAKINPANPAPFQPTPGTVWEVSRLALPLPTLLPSYNQIGFDSLHYLVSIVDTNQGHVTAWMAGAKLAEGVNQTVIDPATRALATLEVGYTGGLLTLANQDGLSVEVTNAVIPFHDFRMATALGSDGNATGSLHIIGSTICGQIAMYGPFLQRLGLCNPVTDLLLVSGASNFKLYPSYQAPSASAAGTVTFAATADAVTATLAGSTLKLAEHIAAILLVDATTGLPISLSYGLVTARTADGNGLISTVSLPVADTSAAHKQVKAYLMIDMTPVANQILTIP
jgi:outer membrane protein assembly factor BamB